MKKIGFSILNAIFLVLFLVNYIVTSTVYAKPDRSKQSKQARGSELVLDVKDVGFKSASFSWEYPDYIGFSMGDYLNLILTYEGSEYMGEAPVLSLAHGKNDTDLNEVTSFKADSLLPETDYRVKLSVVKASGDEYIIENTFSTKEFAITEVSIEGANENVVTSKDIKINWKTSPEKIELGKNDKIQVFIKKLSDTDFPVKPVFETQENVQSASITLPEYEKIYDYKIVYIIDGMNLESDWYFLELKSGGIDFKMEDIKSSSAKMIWTYTNESVLSDKSELKIFLKEEKNITYDDTPNFSIKGKEELLSKKEYIAEKLKFGTKYNVKVQFIVESVTEFEKEVPVVIESEHELETKKFDIKDLKFADNTGDNKVKLTWNFDGDAISFSEGDSLSIYLKESSEDKYGINLVTEQISKEALLTKKEFEITFPKYDTKYDVKLVYSVGGKDLCRYITHTVTIPKIDFGVKVLSDDSIKFKISFDKNKTKFEQNTDKDKVEIFVREHKDNETNADNDYKSINFTLEELNAENKKRLTRDLDSQNEKDKINRDGTDAIPEEGNPSTSNEGKIEKQLKIDSFKEVFPETGGGAPPPPPLPGVQPGDGGEHGDKDETGPTGPTGEKGESGEKDPQDPQGAGGILEQEQVGVAGPSGSDGKGSEGTEDGVTSVPLKLLTPAQPINPKPEEEVSPEDSQVEEKLPQVTSSTNKHKNSLFFNDLKSINTSSNVFNNQVKSDSFVKEVVEASTGAVTTAQAKIYDFKIVVTKDGTLFQEKFYTVEMKLDKFQVVNVDYTRKGDKTVEAKVEYAPYDYKSEPEGTGKECLTCKLEGVSQQKLRKFIKRDAGSSDTDISLDGEELKDGCKFDIPFEDYGKYKLTYTYTKTKTTTAGSSSGGDSGPQGSKTLIANAFVNDGITTQGEAAEAEQPETSTYINFYDNKFDPFRLELRDDIFNEIKLNVAFDSYYKPQNGDKVEIFFKVAGASTTGNTESNNGSTDSNGNSESTSGSGTSSDTSSQPSTQDESTTTQNDGFSTTPLVTFVQENDKIDLKNLGTIDLSGLDAGMKYVFKAKFTPKSNSSNPIEKQKEASTTELKINEIKVEQMSDIVAYVRWKLDKGFEFGPNDILEIYYKPEGKEYTTEPNETVKELYLSDGSFIYLDTVNTNYKIKLIFKSGNTKLEKEVDFSNNIDDINAVITDVKQTSAYAYWNYPKNYNITDGESLSIFVKEKSAEYGEEPDYFMEHYEEENQFLKDFRSIRLSDLMPDTEYNAKILLDFGQVGKEEVELSFKTEPMEITDISLLTLQPNEFEVGWKLNSNTIDFNEEYDTIKIYMKSPDSDFSEDNIIYTITKDLARRNKVRIEVEDPTESYDVKVQYDFVGRQIEKTIKGGAFNVGIETGEEGIANILLHSPPSLVFEDGDSIDIFVRFDSESEFEKFTTFEHSSSEDLNEFKVIPIEGLEAGMSLLVNINNSKTQVFPVQVDYGDGSDSGSEEEGPVLDIVSEKTGNWVDLAVPEEYNLDTESEVLNSIGGESYYDILEDGSQVIVIDRLVPKKVYEDAFVITYDMDGNEVKLNLGDFVLEAATLLEDFLFNSYYFAFERDPDEGGYNYWKDTLEANDEISGKFFLINLMFAEREFADRNLSNEELVKVLYQIVVNREYDEQGLQYWIGVYQEYLNEFNGDQYEAKKKIVLRMAYEQEFRDLCDSMGILW